MGFNMKDLQRMQNQLMKMQEDLQNSTFEGTSGGGAVTITINGKFEMTAVKLQQDAVDPDDVSILEDLILAAYQDRSRLAGDIELGHADHFRIGYRLDRGASQVAGHRPEDGAAPHILHPA
jgi:DNA-binding YbaB/EbfC family protein